MSIVGNAEARSWSVSFPDEFQKRRGYRLSDWLPLFAGIPLESAEESERVLRDVRITIAEPVKDVFYETLATCAREYDCRFSAECVAPTMVSDGMLHYQKVDYPMGSFGSIALPTTNRMTCSMPSVERMSMARTLSVLKDLPK